MPRSVQKVSTTVRSEFEVFDSSNAPVLGLVTGDFTILLSANGVDVPVPGTIVVTITEVGNGRYSATWTPNASTFWDLTIRHATYNKRGWSEGFDVNADGVWTINDLFVKADMVETGWDLRDALRVMAAVLCGKVSGGPGNPVFTNLQQTAPRVDSIADANGNRTTVTLTP
jgi:hypothetical protein